MDKEYINSQIRQYYRVEENSKLAQRLGLSVENLRKKASRLGVKKDLKSNRIVVGECKLCSKCKKILPISNFRKDKYQPNNLDYNCKECRKKNLKIIKETILEKKHTSRSMSFGKKKTRNPIIRIGGADYLRCKSCKNTKLLNEFHKDKNNLSGHKNFCKSCIAEKRKKSN